MSVNDDTAPPLATVVVERQTAYSVWCERGVLGRLVDRIKTLNNVRVVVLLTDTNVESLYGTPLERRLNESGFAVLSYSIEPHRLQKSLETASAIFQQMFDRGVDRNTLVLNVGGGTVGDLGGFISALYLRGVRYVHVPTTLLSQADSGIGGKVNVNFGDHINCLSVFHHPSAVWIDPDVLGTLPEEEYRSGLAEIVKYAVVLDADLFVLLEANVQTVLERDPSFIEQLIQRCVQRKCRIVTEDPEEKKHFRFFNYGHEIGHAVEVAFGYEGLRHGEAVAIGMDATAWLGTQAGLTDVTLLQRQGELLSRLRLPRAIPETLRCNSSTGDLERRLNDLVSRDKKRIGTRLVWIMPVRLGKAICTDQVDDGLVARCLRRVAEGVVA